MNEKYVTNLQLFHEYGVHYATKTINIDGPIDTEMRVRVLNNLHSLDQTSGLITVILSSNGGCVTEGLAIYDGIRLLKNNVRIIGYGEIASMATVILQAADEGMRYLTPNSYLIVHEGPGTTDGTKKTRQEQEKLFDYQEKKCNDIYLEKIKERKPRFTMKKWVEKYLQYDKLLLPKDAIELGLADEIIDPY